MILLELFWNFLVIGAVSFGGGYGMISLVRETVLGHGWLTESEFLSFIAVSESTPGPLAVGLTPAPTWGRGFPFGGFSPYPDICSRFPGARGIRGSGILRPASFSSYSERCGRQPL